MSYILDALKKSDQERQRRVPPGINTIHAPSDPQRQSRRRWPYLLIFALLVNAGLLIWWLRPWQAGEPRSAAQPSQNIEVATAKEQSVRKESVDRRDAAVGEASEHPPGVPGTLKPVAEAVPSEAAGGAKPAGTDKPAPAEGKKVQAKIPAKPEARTVPSSGTGQAPATVEHARGRLQGFSEPAGGAQRSERAQRELEALVEKTVPPLVQDRTPEVEEAPVGAKSSPGIASQREAELPQYHELPLEIRQEIPALSFTMFVYSENPANRLIGVQGRVVREGQELAPGVKVEHITRTGAVLNYRGHRFIKKEF